MHDPRTCVRNLAPQEMEAVREKDDVILISLTLNSLKALPRRFVEAERCREGGLQAELKSL
jgi:hypothetical protein